MLLRGLPLDRISNDDCLDSKNQIFIAKSGSLILNEGIFLRYV